MNSEKDEGETCGWCFNPSINNDCGNCTLGLVCTRDPRQVEIPDLPSTCQKPEGGIQMLHIFVGYEKYL